MRYDENIIDPEVSIFTPFDVTDDDVWEKTEGYFADYIYQFSDLNRCEYGVLEEVTPDADFPFRANVEEGKKCFCLFLHAKHVKTKKRKKEKTYKPFANAKEFFTKTNFEMGDTIRIRNRTDNTEYHLMLVGWTDDGLMLGNMRGLSFHDLLHWFDLWDGENKFIPFGVEE